MSQVYGRYVDTVGNYHYSDIETGHHVIPNTAVGSFPPPRLIKTNADRIRSMTDEELASIITDDWCEIVCSGTYLCNDGTCEQHVLKWLKEEVKDDR